MTLSNYFQGNAKTFAGIGAGVVATIWTVKKLCSTYAERKARNYFDEKCRTWPKDTVILHAIRRGPLAPHISPYVLKLETFLRMHKIPYIFDYEFPFSEKLKMPWITLNGEHFADSQLIMDVLTEKFRLKPKRNYTAVERSTGQMARIMLDEHAFWGFVMWRYVYAYEAGHTLDEMFGMSGFLMKYIQNLNYNNYKKYAWAQGMGRNSQEDVIKITYQDLKAISVFIGNKKFLLGDEPSDDDCAVFGFLAMLVWNDLRSPFHRYVMEEVPNLKEYCFRMKATFWKDWDQIIIQPVDTKISSRPHRIPVRF